MTEQKMVKLANHCELGPAGTISPYPIVENVTVVKYMAPVIESIAGAVLPTQYQRIDRSSHIDLPPLTG